MNPCFESPFFDAGYDVADYYKAAPRYGTNEDLKRLFCEVHRRGMHILLDLVPGHTSIEHKWFQQSMKAEQNEYTGRYIWTDSVWKDFEGINNIRGCLRGVSDRDGSCAANFFSTQPALNYGFAKPAEAWQSAPDSKDALATRQAMKEVMAFWLGLGCDGFRVDMAMSLVKGDDDGQETVKLWQDITGYLKEKFPNAAMISEWGEPQKSLRGGFHMDFMLQGGPCRYDDLFRCGEPYFSRRGKGDISAFVKAYRENAQKTRGKGLMCIMSGNHDVERLRDSLDEEEMKTAFAFIFSLPGAPFLYYGDEIGMRYLKGLKSVEGGYFRTGSRSPMQWDDGPNAGFSSASKDALYITLDPDENRPTVKAQIADEHSLYHTVKRLISLRLEHEALQSCAKIEFLYAEKNAAPLVFKRHGEKETVLVAINPFGEEARCTIPVEKVKEVLYAYPAQAEFKDGVLTVPAGSATYFLL